MAGGSCKYSYTSAIEYGWFICDNIEGHPQRGIRAFGALALRLNRWTNIKVVAIDKEYL